MVTSSPTRFSVIIPAYNEERFLPRLLDSVEVARSAYRGGGPGAASAVEVIVADNSSTDKTAAIAVARGCRLAHVSRRSIAAARNGGAHVASGEILCFVDADSRIHPRTFEAIDAALDRGRASAGATGVYLERKSLGTLLTYYMIAPFAWLTGTDIGVVFCRREDFHAIGGYDESRLYAEDVAFLLRLRRRCRERGHSLVRLRSVEALFSTRKFDEFGDWHYFALALRLGVRLIAGQANDREVADRYWYKPQR